MVQKLCYACIFLWLGSFASARDLDDDATSIEIGAAKRDITGPAAERGMMGYAKLDQETSGIHLRLYARAFVFRASANTAKAAIVVADLGQISEAVRLGVLEGLAQAGLSQLNEQNVMLMATHTHSGPGGYFAKTLYNLTTLGHSKKNYQTIVDGIVAAITDANSRLRPATISRARDQLLNASSNRSLPAFRANFEFSQRNRARAQLARILKHHANKEMTLLKFVGVDGQPIGAINWFAVHQTSMSNHNHLISSDNKGLAAYWHEKFMETTHGVKDFVAAYANAEEGDVSPNIFSEDENARLSDQAKTGVIASRQFHKAKALYEDASIKDSARIAYAHRWVYMPSFAYAPHKAPLCQPAMGYSFAAGAEDGPSNIKGFYEGMKQGDDIDFIFLRLGLAVLKPLVGGGPVDDQCHFPKPILISTDPSQRDWTISTLPFQIIVIGSTAIVGAPGEVTTLAGHRLKAQLEPILRKMGVQHIVIGGLANAYSGYITTREEYTLQHYEGAHNIFGPHTLSAYQTIYSDLAHALVSQRIPQSDPRPVINQDQLLNLRPGVIRDTTPIGKNFGEVMHQPDRMYQSGQIVKVSFISGHPKNNYRLEEGYLEVQMRQGSRWETKYRDDDPSTVYRWKRKEFFGCFGGCSLAKISWTIPEGVKKGRYRIVHRGDHKDLLGGEVTPLIGYSREFLVH